MSLTLNIAFIFFKAYHFWKSQHASWQLENNIYHIPILLKQNGDPLGFDISHKLVTFGVNKICQNLKFKGLLQAMNKKWIQVLWYNFQPMHKF
jgi:hypothetical protein